MTAWRVVAAAMATLSVLPAASAETRLTDFRGEWHGTGQDRDSPMQAMQDTRCRNGVRATEGTIRIDMTCERKSGERKTVRINAMLKGDALSGRVHQRMPRPDGKDRVMGGTLAGQKAEGAASFVLDWNGMTPDTTVQLKLIDRDSFSLQASALAMTFMDVTFKRTSEVPPRRERRERRQRREQQPL